jgi:hypothetical protein
LDKSLKNFQQIDQDDVYDMIPEHLTLVNEEMLGRMSQVNDYNCSPIQRKAQIQESSHFAKPEIPSRSPKRRDRFLSPEQKDQNNDSAINHCTDFSQNLNEKSEIHTLIYDTSILSKHQTDFINKSALNKSSDSENAYGDESGLFNPMTQTKG